MNSAVATPEPDDAPAFTTRELRNAFGMFPTGVTIITAKTPSGHHLGATVSSFNSLSLEPALVLFSIAQTSRAFEAWGSVTEFGVNILGEHDIALSNRFARSIADKWDGIEAVPGTLTNAPLLPDALSWFECSVHERFAGGDHVIIVGRVLHIRTRVTVDPRPLVFFAGKYQKLDRDLRTQEPAADLLPYGW